MVWLLLLLFLIPFVHGQTTKTTVDGDPMIFDSADAYDEYVASQSYPDEHICDDDCTVECLGSNSCPFRSITCGELGGPSVDCHVLCSWNGDGADMSYWLYFDGATPFYDGAGQTTITSPYPPCNQAVFTVNANSHLTITGIGQGVLSWAQVTAQPGSTVNITLTNADWGLLWAEIFAQDGAALEVTVQGEGALWRTIIKCPP